MKTRNLFTVFLSLFLLFPLSAAYSQNLLSRVNEAEELTLGRFLTEAGKNTFFEEILIDTLDLQYSEVLALPAEDVVLSVKSAYRVLFPDGESPAPVHGFNGSVGLSKLFADSGTTLSTSVSTAPAANGPASSQFNLEIAQPIAKNAFGKTNRLTRQMTQIENRILEMQIVEAYEDYYAGLITLYYTWHAEYSALTTSQNSYATSRSLIGEMNAKYGYGIANQLDLDKSNIQFYSKWDSLIEQERTYRQTTDLIKQAMMIDDPDLLFRPYMEDFDSFDNFDFETCYTDFRNNSRTYEVFDLTEQKSKMNVELKADELLPSANLYAQYNLNGKGIFFHEGYDSQSLQIGVDLNYPITSSKERASYEKEKIAAQRTALSNSNKKIELKTELQSLFLRMEANRERIALANERVAMANRIAESENRDYNLGKSDLNDLISALNQVDSVSLSRINTLVRQNQDIVELLRFTDKLVTETVLTGEKPVAERQTR